MKLIFLIAAAALLPWGLILHSWTMGVFGGLALLGGLFVGWDFSRGNKMTSARRAGYNMLNEVNNDKDAAEQSGLSEPHTRSAGL